jgi:D-glycero-alpha-D-manno-heptose-7-phosphate kinase
MTKSPFRLSFFGGGTDYRPFFEQYGGSVLSTTFDKYVYVTLRRCPPFFEYHTQVKYSKTESVRKTEELEHPLVRNCMLYSGLHNLSIAYDADLPARSGLGSSSSFAVALLQAMHAMKGEFASSQKLADEAIHIERELCGESGGWQDQIAAAYGGFNRIHFSSDGFRVSPVLISQQRKNELESCLMMFFTGISRYSGKIASAQIQATSDKTAELKEMLALVDEAEKVLASDCDISEFGKLLNCAWKLKRGLTSEISTDFIDGIYRTAKCNGAIGGKLMGAGGGGFMMFFALPSAHARIRSQLPQLIHVPIKFECEGSKVFHYSSDDFDERVQVHDHLSRTRGKHAIV